MLEPLLALIAFSVMWLLSLAALTFLLTTPALPVLRRSLKTWSASVGRERFVSTSQAHSRAPSE